MSVLGIAMPGDGLSSAYRRKANQYNNLQSDLIQQALNSESNPYAYANRVRDKILKSGYSLANQYNSPSSNLVGAGDILKLKSAALASDAYNNTLSDEQQKRIARRLQAAGMYGNMASNAANQARYYDQLSANAAGSIGNTLGMGLAYLPSLFGKGGK